MKTQLSIAAANSLGYVGSPERTSTLPSAPVVASPSLTKTEIGSSGLSDQEKLICLSALVAALQSEVLSGDQWWMAMHNAQRAARGHGVGTHRFTIFRETLEGARKVRFSSNPLSSMF